MIVSRDDGHKPESYEQMMKLLSYGEIKLVLPEIIINEVERNVEREIDKTYQKLKEAKKNIDGLYWINNAEEMESFKELKNAATFNINELITQYTRNKEKYVQGAKKLLENIFNHSSTVIIKETDDVIKKAYKRQLYKKKPFNEKGKDSLGDAVIIESLIKYISDHKKNNKLFFVSNNTKDFSSETDKEILHQHIQEDIKKLNIEEEFHYRVYFTKTLIEDFQDEIKNAGILEQLIAESYYEDELNSIRQKLGITSLNADWTNILANDSEVIDFASQLLNCHEEISEQFNSFEDTYNNFKKYIESLNYEKLEEVMNSFNINTTTLNKDKLVYQQAILEWTSEKIDIDIDMGEPSEYLEGFPLNKPILKIRDFQGNNFMIEVQGQIFPENDESDMLDITVTNFITNKNAKGSIDIYYGYSGLNDYDSPEGIGEQINLCGLESVIDTVKEVSEFIIAQIEECKEKINEIKDTI